MLCRLHLTAPLAAPLLSRALWPPTRSLFEDLEREMDSLWELLGCSNWPLGAHEEASRGPEESPFAVTQDMAGFDPRELVVKLVGQKLVLTGRKATQTPGGPFRYELFRREWDVPGSVDRQQLSCSISREGQLRIEAAGPAARTVPIEVGRAPGSGQETDSTMDGRRTKG
ncbi:alpha-crystallin A chain-like [Lacerta agilis]|uniref:alpha-crystallin A chain-like n=1 Tax=Lacerta agilis TaxID=80427 RepID=UPI0014199F20|nr:alpha-crystallin A chain-like [Lacerta agilis]